MHEEVLVDSIRAEGKREGEGGDVLDVHFGGRIYYMVSFVKGVAVRLR